MHRLCFYERVEELDVMMGALFYRNVQPSEIICMGWSEMKYWYKWHSRLLEEEKRIGQDIKNA